MSVADLLTAALAKEIAESDVRIFVPTTPATAVAAAAARKLGRPELAMAGGFTALDASPVPSVIGGEAAVFADGPAVRDAVADIFSLLSRGLVGVATAPAQLDSRCRTNLSRIGPAGRPAVALPGARGLPDNNRSPSRVWYLCPAHDARRLVESVDFVCGAEPAPGSVRRLLSPAGCFEYGSSGWRARWVTPAAAELVPAAPGIGIELDGGEPVVSEPDVAALAAVVACDPHDLRLIEFATGPEAAALHARAVAAEAAA